MEQYFAHLKAVKADQHADGSPMLVSSWFEPERVMDYLKRFQTPGANVVTGGNYKPLTCSNFVQVLLSVQEIMMARALPLNEKFSGATAEKMADYRRVILGPQKLCVNAANCLPLDKRRERRADGSWETNRDDKAAPGDCRHLAQ